MSTAFSFNFAADDDDEDVPEDGCNDINSNKLQTTVNDVPPQAHRLQDVLSTFPSHLFFSNTSIPSNGGANIEIPRRALYDIRTQLMAEDGTPSGESVAGLSADDIVPNVYEGGFKTWECSVDLSEYMCLNIDVKDPSAMKDLTVIELGAGTALPSLALLRKWLLERQSCSAPASKLQICLADYNRSVLELATIPNLYLATQFLDQPISETDIACGPEDLERFQARLFDLGIDLSVISGSWTPEFADLIPRIVRSSPVASHETIILASETIYSPASIQMFTRVLLSILKRVESQGSKVRALVAAKRMYFGVGGGTDEFLQVLDDLGSRGSIVWETREAGVGRVIIAVTLAPNN